MADLQVGTSLRLRRVESADRDDKRQTNRRKLESSEMAYASKAGGTRIVYYFRLLIALSVLSGLAQASVGKVTNLSGPLFAVSADGAKRVLLLGQNVEEGETLVTPDRTYARIRFVDHSEVTLRPDTQLKVLAYAFAEAKPQRDEAVLELLKGAVRVVAGLIGKRGNQSAYKITAAMATIEVPGGRFIAEVVPSQAPETSSNGRVRDRTPGLTVMVLDGTLQLSNQAGKLEVKESEAGFAGSETQSPVILTSNPGIQFSVQELFTSSTRGGQIDGKQERDKRSDCD